MRVLGVRHCRGGPARGDRHTQEWWRQGKQAPRPIPPQFPTAKVDGRTAGETSHGGFKRTLGVALLGGLRASRACERLPPLARAGLEGKCKNREESKAEVAVNLVWGEKM